MLPVTEMPAHPNLINWRSLGPRYKVHIARGRSVMSLCGLRVPQIRQRPQEADWVCLRCEDCLRRMGSRVNPPGA